MKKILFLILSITTSGLMALLTSDPMISPGIYAATLTPMQEDLTVDTQELASHCLNLLSRGCSGIVLFGTTGEGPSFSVGERIDVLKQVILKGVPSQNIILGNGSANLSDTVLLAKAAMSYNIKALLIAPPSFFNASEDGVIAFYQEVIQRVDPPGLPILLYHIPQFSGVPITLKIIESLREEFPKTVIGIKESEGNLSLTRAILEKFPGFQVFVGNEKHIPESVYLGGSGSICGMGNLYPEELYSLYQQGKRDPKASSQQIDAVFEALRENHFVSAFKAYLEKKRGKIWRTVRPPLRPLTSEQKKAFLAKLP